MYFGAAKDLPGVRELFFKEAPPPPPKNIEELRKGLDDIYFGHIGTGKEAMEDLLKEEEMLREELIEKWIVKNARIILAKYPDFDTLSKEGMMRILEEDDFGDYMPEAIGDGNGAQEDENMVLEMKRKELLSKYVDEDKDEIVEDEKKDKPSEFLEYY